MAAQELDLGSPLKVALEIYEEAERIGGFAWDCPRRLDQALAHDRYAEVVRRVRPGSVVRFSGDRVFALESFLGRGNVSSVWRTPHGTALRILDPYVFPLAQVLRCARAYAEGHAATSKYTTSVVDLLSPPEQLEYAEVGLVTAPNCDAPILFKDFWWRMEQTRGDLTSFKEMRTADLMAPLDQMNREFTDVVRIIEGLQMAWDGQRWILYDFGPLRTRDSPGHADYAKQTIWHSHLWRRTLRNGSTTFVIPPPFRRLIKSTTARRKRAV